DTLAARPLVFFTHGGSFQTGTSADVDVVSLCHHFAKRGYVTVSINYRLGFYPIDSTNATQAVIRAVQDQKAAIRFFRKDRSTTNTYKIDTTQIWVAGSSAGALTALHTAYLDQISEVPASLLAWVNSNGGLEGTSGNAGFSSDIRGPISLCGALGHATWMTNNDKPMCAVHGTADNVVPYGTGWAMVGTFPVVPVDGDSTINAYAPSVNTECHLLTFIGAGHVPYAGTSASNLAYMDTTVNFVSDFLYHHLNCYLTNVPEIKDFSSSIEVFPNPSTGNINLSFQNYDNKSYSVELFDQLGRSIQKYENQNAKELTLSTSNIHAGMYFVRIRKGDSFAEKKVLIY
ncbi:MAG: T9SS type A sorting domain-containing protein, partial [Bacteroidota bacterium]